MAKLSQAAIKTLADEWAAKRAAIVRAERAREAAIDPIIARHNEELAPILKRHDAKIATLQAEADSIAGEVLGWLEQNGKPIRLEGEKAVAEFSTGTTLGNREIDVKKFLKAAKAKGEAMYECINVLVKKAEELLGKTELEAISNRPITPTKSWTLKLKD